jgi:hypothetical protein
MPLIARGNTTPTWKSPNGSIRLAQYGFGSSSGSGLVFAQPGNVVLQFENTPVLTAHSGGVHVTGTLQAPSFRGNIDASSLTSGRVANTVVFPSTITATTFLGNGSQLTGIQGLPMTLSNIQIASNVYELLDDTAVSTDGGFVIVNGTGFGPGMLVSIGGTQASAVTFVSPTRLHVQVPSKAAGTYNVMTTRADSATATLPFGLSYSPMPVWSTSSTLANVTKTVAFSQTLAATESSGSALTYALVAGSSLPPNVSLTTGGVLSGNITADSGNTTTYAFSVNAIDTQFQDVPRTFSLTALKPVVIASGGAITTSGGYTYHTFTSSSTFTLTSNPFGRTFDVLVVGGGGSGGTLGGGGGGGLINAIGISVANGTYTITVGGGGSNSQFSSYTAIAGGTGGGSGVGSNGGSGGGGGAYSGGSGGGGTGTAGQGNNGGSGGYFAGKDGSVCGGGGGGAGAAGQSAYPQDRGTSGNGGSGVQVWGTFYAGGGGGSTSSAGFAGYAGSGGSGGGGKGVGLGQASPIAGSANTGGGGGGGGTGTGASGGSGIVIIRYIP